MPNNSWDSVWLTLSGSPKTNVEADGGARQASCGGQHQARLDVAGHLRTCLRGHRAVLPVHVFGLGACPTSDCSIRSESDATVGHEQVFSSLEYRSDPASAAECAGLRAERPCLAVYR